VTDQTAPDREELMEQLYTNLRKSRPEAAKEVNWLLVSVAQEARRVREEAEMDAVAWELSIERQMTEMEDELSTGYNLQERRAHLESSARKAQEKQREIQERFDQRRVIFAEMLAVVRESRRVPFQEPVLDEIQLLNKANFLGFQLEMDQKRFNEFYGKNSQSQSQSQSQPQLQEPVTAARELTELERARLEGVDYSRVPESAHPQEQEVDFTRQTEVVREYVQTGGAPARAQADHQTQQSAPTLRPAVRQAEPMISEQLEHEAESNFDF